MEKYRKSLKLQNTLLILGVLCLAAVQVLSFCGVLSPAVQDGHWRDFWSGMIAGAAFGIMVLFMIGLIINLRALRNEAALKKLYAREHDERTAQICYYAQSGAYRLCTLGLLVAIVIAGYFSPTVSLTCLAIVFIQSVTGALFKLYWHKRL
ncbi:MAG: hypothetical protein ACI4GO_00665 [Hominenteromicrobium sp.]